MMTRQGTHVLRYRRSDSTRGDVWNPIGAAWRTRASSWVVAHDLYHHLPGDTGTFAEEIATMGAEYYVNHEGSTLTEIDPPGQNALIGVAASIVGLVFDLSRDAKRTFELPNLCTERLSADIESVFAIAARSAFDQMRDMANDEPGWETVLETYERLEPFVEWMRRGYRDAQHRYPDQMKVRQSMERLYREVRALEAETDEGPFGTEMKVSRQGTEAMLEVVFPDPPKPISEEGLTPAFMMSWSGRRGWSTEGISVHQQPEHFVEFLDEYFKLNPQDTVTDYVLPDGDASRLVRVLIADRGLARRLSRRKSVRLSASSAPPMTRTECGARILGAIPAH